MQDTPLLEAYVKKILTAKVYDVAIETPLSPMPMLSQRLGNQISIKREDLQPVFSFKIRGAYNRLASLTDAQRRQGVVTASAGNHAQGVALGAKQLGIRAVIVMPRITPDIKVAAVRARGAEVVLTGDNFNEALEYARDLMTQEGLTYVAPFDDAEVIAGQGTIAMEILRQQQGPIDAIFVPVGGGGLISGISAYVKYLFPEVKIIGVEPEDAACLKAALEAGEPTTLDQVGVFAEGVAVSRIGELPFEILKDTVDGVITVNADEMCSAVKDIFEDTRGLPETSGAVALAGLKKYIRQNGIQGQNLICINSGANINFDRLNHITERTSLGERREAMLAVKVPERAGSYKALCEVLSNRMVTQLSYRYAHHSDAQVLVGINVTPSDDDADRHALISTLEEAGYPVVDLSENEMAKVHISHLVGGHMLPALPDDMHEELYRFEFPERPGALNNFVRQLPANWNISLFHYRNHGAAYGRVLVALQMPKDEQDGLDAHLDEIGYRYWRETDNPAYGLFLR